MKFRISQIAKELRFHVIGFISILHGTIKKSFEELSPTKKELALYQDRSMDQRSTNFRLATKKFSDIKVEKSTIQQYVNEL